MIVEATVVLVWIVAGALLLARTGFRGWSFAALSMVVGCSLYLVLGAVQLMVGLPSPPVLTLLATLTVAGLGYLAPSERPRAALRPGPALAVVVVTVGLVGLFREARLVRYHWDSVQYLTSAGLIAEGAPDRISNYLFEARTLAVPLLHAPAGLNDELYLRSVTPILALATLAILGWLVREGLGRDVHPREGIAFAIASVLLVASIQRFQFNAFYVNGHLLTALLVMLIAGTGWLSLREAETPPAALAMVQFLAAPVLVISRPEGSLMLALLVLPQIVQASLPRWQRAGLSAVSGLAIAVWHGFLLMQFLQRDEQEAWLYLMIVFGLAIASCAALLIVIERIPRIAILGSESALWLVLVVLAVREPSILVDSIIATARNALLNEAYWGASLAILGILALGLLVATKSASAEVLRYPLTTFVPLVMLLAYVRGGPYRVNPADSLTRMLLHIVPLAVLYLASGAVAAWRQRPQAPRADDQTSASAAPVRTAD